MGGFNVALYIYIYHYIYIYDIISLESYNPIVQILSLDLFMAVWDDFSPLRENRLQEGPEHFGLVKVLSFYVPNDKNSAFPKIGVVFPQNGW